MTAEILATANMVKRWVNMILTSQETLLTILQEISASQPATAIVYQLYLESGPLINVADLWSAFLVIKGEPEDDKAVKQLQ